MVIGIRKEETNFKGGRKHKFTEYEIGITNNHKRIRVYDGQITIAQEAEAMGYMNEISFYGRDAEELVKILCKHIQVVDEDV